jgi:hypothetical protein
MTGSRPVIPPPVGGPELHQAAATDIPIEELAERYQDGATLVELAARYRALRYSVSSDEIRRMLVAVGIRIRSADRPSDAAGPRRALRGTANLPLSAGELAEHYRADASLDDLAILCRCSPARIRRDLAAAGIEIRSRGGLNGAPARPRSRLSWK